MDLQQFNFNLTPVRVVMIDGQPWFVAVDVALILGYRNAPDATRLLDEDEKGTHILRTPGGAQDATVINESGLFNLVLRSRRAEAKAFRKWVTGEVLPALRRTGTYTAAPTLDLSDPLVLAQQFVEAETARRALAAENAVLGPKADVFDALMDSDGLYSIASAAKVLGTGEVRLFTLLRDRRILMDRHRNGPEAHNVPYQQYLERGYFQVKTRPFEKPDGKHGTSITTFVTPKGLTWLQKNMRDQGLLPAPRSA